MKHTDPSLNKSLATGWQMLGELELPVGSNADDKINAWLTEAINPLNLHADFLTKILKSAQDAAARIWQTEAAVKLEHIHFLIFVPIAYTSTGRTWGFFRIEKIESAAASESPPDHAIEFYLYFEG